MLESIYNYRVLSANLSTGGQPDEHELEAICDAPYAVSDEETIIKSRGLAYIHLPVSFETPEIGRFYTFCEIMQRHRDRKIFLHRTANKRVSIFIALYRVMI